MAIYHTFLPVLWHFSPPLKGIAAVLRWILGKSLAESCGIGLAQLLLR